MKPYPFFLSRTVRTERLISVTAVYRMPNINAAEGRNDAPLKTSATPN